jgi:hypothetical protein
MLAIFSAVLIVAVGYPPEARLMPMIIGLTGAGLSLAQLWQSIAAGRRPNRSPRARADAPSGRCEARLLAWFAAFLLGIVAFGFLIAAPVMILGFLVIEQRERAMLSGTLAFGCLTVLYLVFELLLKLSLHRGLVAQLLAS